jgi:hypothetical protein
MNLALNKSNTIEKPVFFHPRSQIRMFIPGYTTNNFKLIDVIRDYKMVSKLIPHPVSGFFLTIPDPQHCQKL